jgi:hypothetical protein
LTSTLAYDFHRLLVQPSGDHVRLKTASRRKFAALTVFRDQLFTE